MNNESFDNDKTQTHVALNEGTLVSHYRIIEKIGAGGMGEVYLADDTELNRKVALKFLPLHLCQDEECRKRFKREAQAAAGLDHPNIVPVYEVGDFKGRPFFSMANIEGLALREVIKQDNLTVSEAAELTMQICEGLHKAHESGVVHRDIKPGNIIIDRENRPRILDFGLATVSSEEKLTKTGSTLGTVGYMSPEQIKGTKVDHRSDLFSVGVILYEMLTGRKPFEGDNDAAVVNAITNSTPEPIARFKSGVTGELQQIVDKALTKDPSLRYQHADGMLADLRRLKAVSSPAKKRRLGLWVTSAIVLIAVTALLLSRLWHQAPVTDDVPRIAVLPFDNLGPPEDEYFADGMTEEITSRLAGIQGLGVISRTSAIKYKNSDKQLGEIGKELGVAYILEGTVRWSKDGEHSRVRITPQLIRVSDDRHLWADNYERELMEVFEVQADIAMQIVEKLGVTLLEKDLHSLSTRLTENADAYKFYLRGVDLMRRMELQQQPLVMAVAMFDSAITLDPEFAMAYAYRSGAQSVCYFQKFGDVSLLAERALQNAEMALSLDPDMAYAHLALGLYYTFVRGDYNRAMEEFSNAKTGLHSNPSLLMGIALVHMRQGSFDKSNDYFQRAAELDPLNPTRHRMLAMSLPYTQEYERAEWAIDQAIWLDKTRPDFYADKIALYATRYGDLERMRQVLHDASEFVEPMAIVLSQQWDFEVYDIPDDSLLSYLVNTVASNLSPVEYYLGVADIYHRLGSSELVACYSDSARVTLEMMIEKVPDDAQLHGMLSVALANLGQYDAAIEEAQRGKELMSVDDCHW